MGANTKIQRQSRINDVVYYIHQNLSEPLNARSLASEAAYSAFHFHRCFKQVMGENVNDYIRRCRLERCANLLMFAPNLKIQSIAEQCGFISPASFSQAFKRHFGQSPSQWRDGGYTQYQKHNHAHSWSLELLRHWQQGQNKPLPPVHVQELPAQQVAYVRHQGYDRSIRQAYEKLHVWANENAIDWAESRLLGILHSNPSIVPAAQCHYVACLDIDALPLSRGVVSSLSIPAGMHACIHVQGHYGDLLPMLYKLYAHWLPQSGYRLGNLPAFVRYRRCHFVNDDEFFDLNLYVPICL